MHFSSNLNLQHSQLTILLPTHPRYRSPMVSQSQPPRTPLRLNLTINENFRTSSYSLTQESPRRTSSNVIHRLFLTCEKGSMLAYNPIEMGPRSLFHSGPLNFSDSCRITGGVEDRLPPSKRFCLECRVSSSPTLILRAGLKNCSDASK